MGLIIDAKAVCDKCGKVISLPCEEPEFMEDMLFFMPDNWVGVHLKDGSVVVCDECFKSFIGEQTKKKKANERE